MKYTIEDLRGKYVKTGTPEAEVFLDACEELGLKWCESGAEPRGVNHEFVAVCNDGCDNISNDNVENGCALELFTINHEWSIYTNGCTYRAKQKSERELFVDEMMAGCSFDNSHAQTVRSVVEQIYDSGKVKLVKDGE